MSAGPPGILPLCRVTSLHCSLVGRRDQDLARVLVLWLWVCLGLVRLV